MKISPMMKEMNRIKTFQEKIQKCKDQNTWFKYISDYGKNQYNKSNTNKINN